ncbi:hypothetical protein [Halocola ammonii]
MKNLSKFTQYFLGFGLVLIIYGYVSRIVGLYFFWESKSVGWGLILIGLIGLLSDRVRVKRKIDKNSVLEKIGIGLIVFIILIQTILITTLPFSEAYSVSKKFLTENQQVTDEVGKVEGFGIIPRGAIGKSTDSEGTYGAATLNLTVKGQKKYKDVTVYVFKYTDEPNWIVEEID